MKVRWWQGHVFAYGEQGTHERSEKVEGEDSVGEQHRVQNCDTGDNTNVVQAGWHLCTDTLNKDIPVLGSPTYSGIKD
jgi:hypothetical protein